MLTLLLGLASWAVNTLLKAAILYAYWGWFATSYGQLTPEQCLALVMLSHLALYKPVTWRNSNENAANTKKAGHPGFSFYFARTLVLAMFYPLGWLAQLVI